MHLDFCPILYVETLGGYTFHWHNHWNFNEEALWLSTLFLNLQHKTSKEKIFLYVLWLIKRFFNNTWNTDLRISEKAATFELRSYTWENDILHQQCCFLELCLWKVWAKIFTATSTHSRSTNVIYCLKTTLFFSSCYPKWCLTTHIKTTHKQTSKC
jgi:hypothetical protein